MNLKEVLHNTLAIQTHSGETGAMQKYLKRFARKHNIPFKEDRGNIYMTKGSADKYPCVVAHTDTVHKIIENFKVLFVDGIYFGWDADKMEFSGVGGDDKVGIAIALKMLLDHDTMKAAFFVDEEIGCVGSGRSDMEFFDDCTIVIQCDRRGNKDLVNRVYGETLFGQEFESAINPIMELFGRKLATGMLTDVYTLRKRGLKTASMNLSTGYYKPHTNEEYVIYSDVESTYDFVRIVFSELGDRFWHFAREIRSSNVVSWPPAIASVIVEEEEEDNPFFQDSAGIFVQYKNFINGTDICPNCEDSSLVYDDTSELYYCMTCCDYLIAVDEEGEIIDVYV